MLINHFYNRDSLKQLGKAVKDLVTIDIFIVAKATFDVLKTNYCKLYGAEKWNVRVLTATCITCVILLKTQCAEKI